MPKSKLYDRKKFLAPVDINVTVHQSAALRKKPMKWDALNTVSRIINFMSVCRTKESTQFTMTVNTHA